MNKKGYGIGLMSMVFVLVLVVMVLALAQNGIDTSTINKTIESLNWSRIGGDAINSLEISANGATNNIAKVILNIASKAVDFIGYGIFEVAKLAMELARDNPDIINYKVLLALILLSLLAPLIYPAFIIVVSLILIIKEAIQNRKERKNLELIKGLNKTGGKNGNE